jgi:hypothetical protein
MASTTTTTTPSGNFSPSEWTQQNMLSDLMQQRWLLIGAGCFIGALWLLSRRSAPEEKAARRLVRDFRKIDDAGDVRDLLGENMPTILKPALLNALEEIERQVHRWFRQVEREIESL